LASRQDPRHRCWGLLPQPEESAAHDAMFFTSAELRHSRPSNSGGHEERSTNESGSDTCWKCFSSLHSVLWLGSLTDRVQVWLWMALVPWSLLGTRLGKARKREQERPFLSSVLLVLFFLFYFTRTENSNTDGCLLLTIRELHQSRSTDLIPLI
jgi:hypothetical protein